MTPIDEVMRQLSEEAIRLEREAAEQAAAEELEPEELERRQLVRLLHDDARAAIDREADAGRLHQQHLALKLRDQLQFDDARGEIGLAQQFARIAFGQHYRSLPREKLWVKFDVAAGIYRDADVAARELAKLLIAATVDRARAALRRATRTGGPEDVRTATQALAAAKKLQKASVITAVLDAARTDPMLVTDLRLFDSNRDELVVHNGIVDLRAGALKPHDPKNLVRKRAGTRYDPAARCPTWTRFLVQIMRGDRAMVRFLQRAIGYTLTGHVREEVMFFAYGGGMNGKSLVANVLQALLDDYYVRVSGDFLMATPHANREGATPGMARIAGARIVMVNEVESNAMLSGQQVKVLVSTETISARELYRAPFEFDPTHKVWVRGNHKPIVRDTDFGFWRRMVLIPFLFTIDKAAADLKLQDKLLAELPGILRWAVDGARAWYAEGRLTMPRAVLDATAQYQSDSDVIERWLADGFKRVNGASEPAATVFNDYVAWCEAENLKPASRPALTNRLADKGITVERRRVGERMERFYVGLLQIV
jgi:putative DNA primase/helicase